MIDSIPIEVVGTIDDMVERPDVGNWYPWLKQLTNRRIYIHLSACWGNGGSYPPLPPRGYRYYIVNGDSGMTGWAEHLVNYLQAPVYCLSLPYTKGYHPTVEGVTYLPYTGLHRQLAQLKLQPHKIQNKQVTCKVSALTGRITQSKALVFAAIMENFKNDEVIVSLPKNIESKNVHDFHPTGIAQLDQLLNIFKEKYAGQEFVTSGDRSSNTIWHDAYQSTAINFTQESFHYSFMSTDHGDQILPGPFLTEKTLKCLLSGTAFIPVGQYNTYQFLNEMGCVFDYGKLNLDFDQDPKNLSRLCLLTNTIEQIAQYSIPELLNMTQASTTHNYQVVYGDEFWKRSEQFNQDTIGCLEAELI